MTLLHSSSINKMDEEASVQPAPKMDVRVDTDTTTTTTTTTTGDGDDDGSITTDDFDAKDGGRRIEALIALLPTNSRSRARIVVNALGNKLKYDKSTWLWMRKSKNGDGELVGSHVVDLLRWAVAVNPLMASTMKRPLDAMDFLRFLVENGVPKHVIQAQYDRYMPNGTNGLDFAETPPSPPPPIPIIQTKRKYAKASPTEKPTTKKAKWLKY